MSFDSLHCGAAQLVVAQFNAAETSHVVLHQMKNHLAKLAENINIEGCPRIS